PGSPKLNGSVERANRTHTEEFYEVADCSRSVSALNPQLIKWEYTYNCIRPHAALNLKSPLQFLRDHGIVLDTNLSVSYVLNGYMGLTASLLYGKRERWKWRGSAEKHEGF
ncbi:MAG: integrase core domain-containing protein, partial [Nitrospirota bacterium]|nr:integrase core domain-containing protein [Nitrospirota bacterium]